MFRCRTHHWRISAGLDFPEPLKLHCSSSPEQTCRGPQLFGPLTTRSSPDPPFAPKATTCISGTARCLVSLPPELRLWLPLHLLVALFFSICWECLRGPPCSLSRSVDVSSLQLQPASGNAEGWTLTQDCLSVKHTCGYPKAVRPGEAWVPSILRRVGTRWQELDAFPGTFSRTF